MIDTKSVNLLTLIGNDVRLKKVAGTNGGEYAGPCPFCGGSDRFRVWPDAEKPSFWCRQCNAKGDAINYVMLRYQVQLGEALGILNIKTEQPRSPRRDARQQRAAAALEENPVNQMDREYNCFDPAWQQEAWQFVWRCYDELRQHEQAVQYLWQRGITPPAQDVFQLGYNPTEYRARWGKVDVWLPAGIVIPWEMNSLEYFNIRVRRLDGKGDKYTSARGVANAAYNINMVGRGSIVVLVEGEFDAMLITWVTRQAGWFGVVGVATGSASGARLMRWVTHLRLARKVLLAFDADAAGSAAASWWHDILTRTRKTPSRLVVPVGKDVTDAYLAGVNLCEWIQEAVN